MRDTLKDFSALPARLVLGYGFTFHGYSKRFSSDGHAGFAGMLQNIGVPVPEVAAWTVGAIEFFGGLALIVGAFVAIVATLQIGVMLTTRQLHQGRAWRVPRCRAGSLRTPANRTAARHPSCR